MVKTQISLEYLKQDEKIKDFLKYTNKSEKSLKTHFSAYNKFFPYLVNFFEIIEDFDLNEYLSKKINETNQIKIEWIENDIVDKTVKEWLKIDAEKKSNLFMKWANSQGEDKKNTYMNYVWRVQGLFAKVGREWTANPKTMEQIKSNGFHLEEEIVFADVGELYNKLRPKYKMILKMMMYTGLNPADLVKLKPKDFQKISNSEKYGEKVYYFVNKDRTKTTNKNVQFIQVYTESFMNEIIEYFQTEKILKYNKTKQANKVEQLKKDPRFEVVKEFKNFIEFNGKKDWKKDQNKEIFGGIRAEAISDAFSYHNGSEHRVLPSTVRSLCFTRLRSVFSMADEDIYLLWTQHKAGMITKAYIMDLIPRIIGLLEDNKIQSAVLLSNMGDYIKENITLKDKIDDIETMKVENKELKQEMESMKQLHKEEMNNLRTEVKSMFEELGYKKDLNQKVKKGEISEGEARVEYQGIELTEKEKHSKFVKKSK